MTPEQRAEIRERRCPKDPTQAHPGATPGRVRENERMV